MSDYYSTGQPQQQPDYGYGQQQPDYGYAQPAPYGEPAPARPKSKALGLWSLILAAVALVVGVGAGIWMGAAVAPYGVASGVSYEFSTDTMPPEAAGAVLVSFVAWGFASLLGIVAIVLSIIGMVKNAGRGLAIAALVIALIAPVASFFAIGVAATTLM
ncbi:hypothetical protein [Agrococcus casei]|uniref:DUF4064 domain-containing protein n=1 Tax=Agrococcus casei LMG 22410 TaxID=1255656 RepID=A0A1R4G5R4_9MICO|nr:hypothetical protein [Agrococcus casei]SJM63580.1 hypothetical protein CZ674_09075 [Agrococcus casei LMG 22410]